MTEKTQKKRGKSIVEGGNGTATRTAGLLGGILTFAVSEGIIQTNPSIGGKRPADNHRVRRLSAEEYRQLGKTLEAAEATIARFPENAHARRRARGSLQANRPPRQGVAKRSQQAPA